MKYKAGDTVRIKSYEEIKKTLNSGNRCKSTSVYFAQGMEHSCGKTFVIDVNDFSERPSYYLSGSIYWWSEEWLEPLHKPIELDERLFTL